MTHVTCISEVCKVEEGIYLPSNVGSLTKLGKSMKWIPPYSLQSVKLITNTAAPSRAQRTAQRAMAHHTATFMPLQAISAFVRHKERWPDLNQNLQNFMKTQSPRGGLSGMSLFYGQV